MSATSGFPAHLVVSPLGDAAPSRIAASQVVLERSRPLQQVRGERLQRSSPFGLRKRREAIDQIVETNVPGFRVKEDETSCVISPHYCGIHATSRLHSTTQPRLYSSSVRESALRKTQQVRRRRTIDVRKASRLFWCIQTRSRLWDYR